MATFIPLLSPITNITPSQRHSLEQETSFDFITQNSVQKLSKNQRNLIKSHASRGKRKKNRRPLQKSWILQRYGHLVDVDEQYTSIPIRVGSDLSFITFPVELEPYMRDDIARAIGPMRSALYPPDVCMQVDPALSSWTTNLLADVLYLHSTIFSVEAFLDSSMGRGVSSLTQFHLSKTLRLLQERLNAPGDPRSITDATIMVVSVLALTAELHGDVDAARAHMQGLQRMILLRGGLDKLRFENSRLPAKVCRVDLSVAIRFGQRPLFFNHAMSWDPFIHIEELKDSKAEDPGVNTASEYMRAADEKLYNIWKDLREFCRLCNLASQTSHKLLPNTFSEIMVSVLYRLINISFESRPVLEAIRLAMTVFASQIFLQWRGMRQRQTQLDHDFTQALLKFESTNSGAPVAIIFWTLIVWHTCSSGHVTNSRLTAWLKQTTEHLALDTCQDAKRVLKSALWIDILYDGVLGKLFKGS